MDWFKVKANHILYEYSDLTSPQAWAWITAMALTSALEKMPTQDQLFKHIDKRVLSSLESKLKVHQTSLESVLKKVLEDVDYTQHLRKKNSSKIAKWREKRKGVTGSVTVTETVTLPDKIREDKRRLDKREKGFAPPTQEEVSSYCQERNNGINARAFIDYYSARGWMIGKNKMKDWKAAVRNWENRREEKKGVVKNGYTVGVGTEEYQRLAAGRK